MPLDPKRAAHHAEENPPTKCLAQHPQMVLHLLTKLVAIDVQGT
jgi:hypothetical protein